jgi:hypothetical protein
MSCVEYCYSISFVLLRTPLVSLGPSSASFTHHVSSLRRPVVFTRADRSLSSTFVRAGRRSMLSREKSRFSAFTEAEMTVGISGIRRYLRREACRDKGTSVRSLMSPSRGIAPPLLTLSRETNVAGLSISHKHDQTRTPVAFASFWGLRVKMTCSPITLTSLRLSRKANYNRATKFGPI